MTSLDYFISRSMSHPLEFKSGEYRWTHSISDVSIWIANGFLFYEFEGGGKIPFFEKFKVAAAIRKWKIAYMAAKIDEQSNA